MSVRLVALTLMATLVACDLGDVLPSMRGAGSSSSAVEDEPKPASSAAKKEALVASLETLQAFVGACSKRKIKLTDSTIITEKQGNDPNKLVGRPGQYLAKLNWKINGNDATIEVFANGKDAKRRADYVEGIAKASPMFLQYIYVHPLKHAVLRVPKELSPSDAEKWEALLLSI